MTGAGASTGTIRDHRGGRDRAADSDSPLVLRGVGVRGRVRRGPLDLPWERLYWISVVFTEGVTADPAALVLTGLSGAISTTFNYDAATRTATWTPTVADLGDGRVTVRLIGAWLPTRRATPSRLTGPGRFGLLTGDYDGNGLVDNRDLAAIKKKLTRRGWHTTDSPTSMGTVW